MLELPTGETIADYAVLRATGVRNVDGLPLFKPPYARLTAIDMNTGEHLWQIPTGETPRVVLEHPDLQGRDLPNTGTPLHAPTLATSTMVMYTSLRSDGTPALFGVDKTTGEQVGVVEIEDRAFYGNMSYVHEGRQYVVLQTGPKLTVLALPQEGEGSVDEAHD
jgi:quinoprotein glucose dehydrogenase